MRHVRNGYIAALLLFAAYCAMAAVATKPTKPVKPSGQSDAALEASIKARFAKSKISADHFTVKVQNGVATVEGKTDVIQHKGTATRIVHACGGQIDNKIQISAAAKEKALARLNKGKAVQHSKVSE